MIPPPPPLPLSKFIKEILASIRKFLMRLNGFLDTGQICTYYLNNNFKKML